MIDLLGPTAVTSDPGPMGKLTMVYCVDQWSLKTIKEHQVAPTLGFIKINGSQSNSLVLVCKLAHVMLVQCLHVPLVLVIITLNVHVIGACFHYTWYFHVCSCMFHVLFASCGQEKPSINGINMHQLWPSSYGHPSFQRSFHDSFMEIPGLVKHGRHFGSDNSPMSSSFCLSSVWSQGQWRNVQ